MLNIGAGMAFKLFVILKIVLIKPSNQVFTVRSDDRENSIRLCNHIVKRNEASTFNWRNKKEKHSCDRRGTLKEKEKSSFCFPGNSFLVYC